MKNIKFILPLLLLFSCKKEVTIKEKTCNCYERHEAFDTYAKPNGLAGAGWMFKYNTTKAPDLCEKETGQWIYSGNPTNKRYLVICN
jgi:hypothetical protein